MSFYFKVSLTVLHLLFFSNVSLANKVGNGGNVVLCKVSKYSQSNLSLLDFYESPDKIIQARGTPETILLNRLEQLKKEAPAIASQYSIRLKQLVSELDFKKNIQLTTVLDSLHLFKPLSPKCELVQIAIRKSDAATEQNKRFLIREDLWTQLDSVHQAGLLAHEIIYEHLFKMGEDNSIKARRINRYLFSEKLDTMEFWNLISELKLPIYP